MHPAISLALDTLSYSNCNIDRIFLEYDGYVNGCKVLLYVGTKAIEKEIPVKKLVTVLGKLLGPFYAFTVDVSASSLYSMHRKVRFLRLILPDNLLSLNYDDEKLDLDVHETIEANLREEIK